MKYILITIIYTLVVIFSSISLYGQDNKLVNKILKQELPCDKKPIFGSYFLHDTDKKVEVYGKKGFPIYAFMLGMQPKTISMLRLMGGFEIIDKTKIRNILGTEIEELSFEGTKVIITHQNGTKANFYECTENDLEVDKVIEKIREIKNIKFNEFQPNIEF